MNNLDAFQKLAAQAGRDTPPEIDVTGRVLDSLRSTRSLPEELPMLAFTGLSMAAASVVGFFAYQAWVAAQDPFVGFFTSLTMVMR